MITTLKFNHEAQMLKTIILLTLSLLSFNTLAISAPTDLFSSINLRLSYMEDVSLYKANNNKPIEDIEREVLVIERASQSAEKFGLNKQSIADFFQAQISAAKAIQYRYRADFLSQPERSTPRDLENVIRPELIKLGKKINSDIAEYLKEGGAFYEKDYVTFKKTLDSRYLSDADKEALFKALAQIKLQYRFSSNIIR